MAFADPTSITYSGTTAPLNRTGSGSGIGEFRDVDSKFNLKVSHVTTAKGRSKDGISLRIEKIATDPLVTTVNRPYSQTVTINLDSERAWTTTEKKDAVLALATLLTANTNALLLKLIGGES